MNNPLPYFCQKCVSPRPETICWKCGGETFIPHADWTTPELPTVGPVREAARTMGYAIGEHGSHQRDLDLIAVPWCIEAVAWEDLVAHICLAVNARQIGKAEIKPFNRIAVTLQIDGWFRPIDLSIITTESK